MILFINPVENVNNADIASCSSQEDLPLITRQILSTSWMLLLRIAFLIITRMSGLLLLNGSILCLHAEEAVYHLLCNTRFRNKKCNPKLTVVLQMPHMKLLLSKLQII